MDGHATINKDTIIPANISSVKTANARDRLKKITSPICRRDSRFADDAVETDVRLIVVLSD